MDAVGKWLVITRAAVFPMTIWSGLIGGLLAVGAARTGGRAPVDYGLLALAVVGLVLAHAANNMINDYFDMTGGIDTDDYVRALYAPHPILSGWVTKAQLRAAILLVNRRLRGDHARAGGRARAADRRLRPRRPVRVRVLRRPADPAQVPRPRRARRVPRVGPADGRRARILAATGTVDWWVLLVSVPYALIVTAVLFGKHIDKIEADRQARRPDAAGHPRRGARPTGGQLR